MPEKRAWEMETKQSSSNNNNKNKNTADVNQIF